MSYTKDDLAAIDNAIKEFALGNRVGEVICNGRRIKYADVTMVELQNLRSQIGRALNAGRTRFRQVISSKGL